MFRIQGSFSLFLALLIIPSAPAFLLQQNYLLRNRAWASTELGSAEAAVSAPSLKGTTVLVCGANGYVGSRVVRDLLRMRDGPSEVRAVVRDSEETDTFARLSFEIGAEEGKGTISPVWVTRQVSFEGTEAMRDYGLSKIKVLSGDLLDAEFVGDAVRGIDAVVFCAGSSSALAAFVPSAIFRRLQGKKGTVVAGSVAAEGVELISKALAAELKRKSFLGTSKVKFHSHNAAQV